MQPMDSICPEPGYSSVNLDQAANRHPRPSHIRRQKTPRVLGRLHDKWLGA